MLVPSGSQLGEPALQDRTIDLERRKQLVDQHTFEKEYKVQTGLTGEHEIKDRVQVLDQKPPDTSLLWSYSPYHTQGVYDPS